MAAARPVVLAAGGTGGHVFPAEALAGELEARGVPFALVTDARGRVLTFALMSSVCDRPAIVAGDVASGIRGVGDSPNVTMFLKIGLSS